MRLSAPGSFALRNGRFIVVSLKSVTDASELEPSGLLKGASLTVRSARVGSSGSPSIEVPSTCAVLLVVVDGPLARVQDACLEVPLRSGAGGTSCVLRGMRHEV